MPLHMGAPRSISRLSPFMGHRRAPLTDRVFVETSRRLSAGAKLRCQNRSAPLMGSSICTDKWSSLPSPTVGKDGFKTILSTEPGLPSSFLGPSPAGPLSTSPVQASFTPLMPSRPALHALPLWAHLEAWGPEPLCCQPLSTCRWQREPRHSLLTHDPMGLKQPEIPSEGMRKV